MEDLVRAPDLKKEATEKDEAVRRGRHRTHFYRKTALQKRLLTPMVGRIVRRRETTRQNNTRVRVERFQRRKNRRHVLRMGDPESDQG